MCRASDGLTLVISSSDGFCSTLSFSPGELGEIYKGEVGPPPKAATASASGTAASTQNTPNATPTTNFAPPSPFPNGSNHQHRNSGSSFTAPSPPASVSAASQRPASPARSNSTSSVATQASPMPPATNPPSLVAGTMPTVAAANSGKVAGVPITTPPETPKASSSVAGTKREADGGKDEAKEPKKRRIAPTPVEPKP